ncbi:stage II sporulation protein M [Paenibacillus sp. 1001270B_150601_E10]|uniref:stage II sporulation protein M n=1 Tax=Paenibacillus sp. 1001270B_150601_E10 TaxID=2787079 RepID=UPI0018A02698|nr:stage II sporulation protein M [Paenibacillus sp. 1001270B_150601_E10]
MLSFKAFIRSLMEIKWYIVASALLMVVGYIIGNRSTALEEFLMGQLEALKQLQQQMAQSPNQELSFFITIFYNNAIKSVLIMFAGIIGGIIPAAFLVINGMVLGLLLRIMSAAGVDITTVVVKGLLPHGILEIPAIIIAAAFGLRFGILIFQRMSAQYRSNPLNLTIGLWSKKTAAAAVWITFILLIAAIIESTITFWLMSAA